MALQLLTEKENKVLNRLEVKCVFRGVAGHLTRADAIQAVSKQFNIEPARVIPISLKTKTGVRDVDALFYIYNDLEEAKRQLPKHLFIRMLSKEERKKKLEEAKKLKSEKVAKRR